MRHLLLALLWIYQTIINPCHRFLIRIGGLVETPCRYPVSCSHFAVDEIRSGKSVGIALKNILLRILSCQDMW